MSNEKLQRASSPHDEVDAEVIPSEDGGRLSIKFTVKGPLAVRVRQAFNVIKDKGSVSRAMAHLLHIAVDAVELIDRNSERIYP